MTVAPPLWLSELNRRVGLLGAPCRPLRDESAPCPAPCREMDESAPCPAPCQEALTDGLSRITRASARNTSLNTAATRTYASQDQGLTLVHFPAQLKHITWDRGA